MSQHDNKEFEAMLNDILNSSVDTSPGLQNGSIPSFMPVFQDQQQQQQHQPQQQQHATASLFAISPQLPPTTTGLAPEKTSTSLFDPARAYTPTPQIFIDHQRLPNAEPQLQFQLNQDLQSTLLSPAAAPSSPYLVPSNELSVPGQYALPSSSALASPIGSAHTSPRGSFSGGTRPEDFGTFVGDAGNLLIPQARHRRSSSVHSDASPQFSAVQSPQLPLSHSPYMESVDVSNLEGVLSSAFSISDPVSIATPEIMVETVDDRESVYSSASVYSGSPAPFTPGQFYSDVESDVDSGAVFGSTAASPMPQIDASSLLHPHSQESPQNRRRSLSDSALAGPSPIYVGGIYGSSPFGSNTSLVNEAELPTLVVPGDGGASNKPDFLSPEATPRRRRGVTRSPSPRGRAITSRDHILEMAGTPVGGSGGAGTTRRRSMKQHPAQHMCSMCDKTFTRAYNLQSHLRTHTNERPFKCSVCGKAFARQHDRKRHEDLHSGHKKYECSGVLADGVTRWGCGHKFARADALGRHFRTEVGRQCIRPLVEEAEREKQEAEAQNAAAAAAAATSVPIYQGGVDAPALTLSPRLRGPRWVRLMLEAPEGSMGSSPRRFCSSSPCLRISILICRMYFC